MVSQGSAATYSWYGGIYNAHFVENFVLSLTLIEF